MNFKTALLLLVSFVFSILGGFIALNGKTIEERNLGIGCLGLFGLSFIHSFTLHGEKEYSKNKSRQMQARSRLKEEEDFKSTKVNTT